MVGPHQPPREPSRLRPREQAPPAATIIAEEGHACTGQTKVLALPPAVPPAAAQEEPDEEDRNCLRSWALRSPARGRRGRRSSAHPPTCPPTAAQEHRAAGLPARSRQPAPCPAAPPGWLAASPVEESSVPVGQRTTRTPPPLSAPPPAERSGGEPLPAPALPASPHAGESTKLALPPPEGGTRASNIAHDVSR